MARDDDYRRDDLYLFDDVEDADDAWALDGPGKAPPRRVPVRRAALCLAALAGGAVLAWFLLGPGSGESPRAAEASWNGAAPSGIVRLVGGGSVLAPTLSR
jgi:hypothetical protein